jgi:hypothetical protein
MLNITQIYGVLSYDSIFFSNNFENKPLFNVDTTSV